MPAARRHAHVVNIEEVTPMEENRGGFAFRARRLGGEAGGGGIGCRHYEVPAGKTAFPFHFHSALEEALYILDGRGTVRIGKEKVEVGPGDYVAFPPGPEHAHQLVASSDGPLRYLCLSGPATPLTLDIVGYPDSKKVAYAAGINPAKGMRSAWLMKIVNEDQPSLDYYEGEPLAQR